jgi:hypothetical protein
MSWACSAFWRSLSSCWRGGAASAFAVLLALALGGCLVQSGAPLSPLGRLPADSPLLGTWIHSDKDEASYFHCGNEGNFAKVIEVDLRKNDGGVKSETYLLATTSVDGRSYLSLQLPGDGPKKYLWMKYQFTGKDKLTLWFADDKFLAEAVKSGALPGTVKPDAIPRVFLTADAERLRRFVGENDARIFTGKPLELRRL